MAEFIPPTRRQRAVAAATYYALRIPFWLVRHWWHRENPIRYRIWLAMAWRSYWAGERMDGRA